MSKTVTLRLSDESYETFQRAAESQRRALSNLIETSALEKICEDQFSDDLEMAELLENEALLKRLRGGSRDAKNKKGQFVE